MPGRQQYYSESYLTPITTLQTNIVTGSTGPTAADFITGSIDLRTAVDDAANCDLHLWVVLKRSASASFHVWAQVTSVDWCSIGKLSVNKLGGERFVIENCPMALIRLSVGEIAGGTSASIYYQYSV